MLDPLNEAWLKLKHELEQFKRIERNQAGLVAFLSAEVRPYYETKDRLYQSGVQTHDCKRHGLDSPRELFGRLYVTCFRPDTTVLRQDIFTKLDHLSKIYGPRLNETKEAKKELKILRNEMNAILAQLYPKKRTRRADANIDVDDP